MMGSESRALVFMNWTMAGFYVGNIKAWVT